jgi:SAM-dependent methyltransferase
VLRWRKPRPDAIAGPPPPRAVDEATAPREEYRVARFALLRRLANVERAHGLEVGAFDFPTVPADFGRCEIADTRDPAAQARAFNVPVETIAPVDHVLERGRPLAEQIRKRFDYVILCHVIEHVPEPIRFLNDVAALLHPGGVMLLAVPDKRRTLDWCRPSTTIEDLLERHHAAVTTPTLAQIMEFSRTWCDTWRDLAERSPRDYYAWAVEQYESGRADVHCNVWQDDELFAQLDYLVRGGFLPRMEIIAREPNARGLNEFYVALRRDGGAAAR